MGISHEIGSHELDERTWWNQFGHLNERVWQYTPYLNRIVRSDYLAEMESFLFEPGGRLLDVGCGHGWVGLRLAERGMQLDGIDLSDAQIEEARRRAAASGLPNVRFWRADARSLASDGQYDAIIVHALLHHLDTEAQIDLLHTLAGLLRVKGRAYLYEPVAAAPNPPLPALLLDKVLGGFFIGLTRLAWAAGLMAPEFSQARASGWTMRSPDEAPIQLEQVLSDCPEPLHVVNIKVWQAYSIAYANLCMMLRQPWQDRLSRLAPIVYRFDRVILNQPWRRHLRAWPMAGIALEKTLKS